MTLEEQINKKIDELLCELKRCKNQGLRLKIVNALVVISEIINTANLNIIFPDELAYEVSRTNLNASYKLISDEFIKNYDYLYDYNYKLTSKLKVLANYYPSNNFKLNNKVDINESIKMALTFYKFYNDKIYKYLYELLEANKIYVTNKIDNGITTTANEFIEPYTFINIDNSIKDVMTIIHETIHNYMFNRLRYRSNQANLRSIINNLQEVYPTFLEIVACDYFKSINYNVEDIKEYERIKDASLINMINRFYNSVIAFDGEKYKINEAYSYGGVLAYHYFDMYNSNRNEAKVNILNLSLKDGDYDKIFMLDKFGLDKKRLLNKKVLNNYISKHYK